MNLEIKEETGALRVLYLLLQEFKFGTEASRDRRLVLLGSPLLKDLFESVQKAHLDSVKTHTPHMTDEPEAYIEDHPDTFTIVKGYLEGYKKGISYWEDMHWHERSAEEKQKILYNLAYPYRIREETVSALLDEA